MKTLKLNIILLLIFVFSTLSFTQIDTKKDNLASFELLDSNVITQSISDNNIDIEEDKFLSSKNYPNSQLNINISKYKSYQKFNYTAIIKIHFKYPSWSKGTFS